MSVDCSQHGSSREAFICTHLQVDPAQRWYSSAPTTAVPCPDAWCQDCDLHFQEQGEWNEDNEDRVPIVLVCQGCYASLRLFEVPAHRTAPSTD